MSRSIVIRLVSHAVVATVCLFFLRSASAAPDPLKLSRKCRAAIGREAGRLFNTAFGAVDACHKARNKGDYAGDCTPLSAADLAQKLQARETALPVEIDKRCATTDPVRANYVNGQIDAALFAALAEIDASGVAVQGAPTLVGDRPLVKCHAAIGRVRTRLAMRTVKTTLRCQRALDKNAMTFGPLDPSCRSIDDPKAEQSAQRTIARACENIGGTDVGNNCASLPEGVADTAVRTGRLIGAAVYDNVTANVAAASVATGPRALFGPLTKIKTVFRPSGNIVRKAFARKGTPVGRRRNGTASLFGPLRKIARPGGGNTFRVRHSGGRRTAHGASARQAAEPNLLVAMRLDKCTFYDDFFELPFDAAADEVELDTDFFEDLSGETFSLAFAFDRGDGASEFTDIEQKPTGGPLRLVKDIRPGPVGSEPLLFASAQKQFLGNVVFFRADDGEAGREVWRSDGTEDGTFRLADLNPGPNGSIPGDYTQVGDLVFFTVGGLAPGSCELWKTDGTPDGTDKVAAATDLDAHKDCISDLTSFQGTLYFTLTPPLGVDAFRTLWRTDGTLANTAPFAGIEIVDNFSSFAVLGDSLFFAARDGTAGNELWRTDGTEAGTSRLVDINPGMPGSNPFRLTVANNRLYFSANDTMNAIEPRVSDGTAANTRLLLDVEPGTGSSNGSDFTAVGDTVFFASSGPVSQGLWRTDGTPEQTSQLKTLDIVPFSLVSANGRLLFSADDGVSGYELWRSDGTTLGTVQVRDIFPGSNDGLPTRSAVIGPTYFFTAFDARGAELWQSDGTLEGTDRVRDIFPGSGAGRSGFGVAVGNRLLFAADDGENGSELWTLSE